MERLTYAERLAARPAPLTPGLAPPPVDPTAALLALCPEELVVEHPDADLPLLRQAGTLGEATSAIQLVKETAERNLYYFNLVFMGGHTLMQPQPHQQYCDFLQSVPPWRKLLLAPRGTLKTTITEGMLLHFFVQPMGANCYFPHGKIGYLNHNEGRSTRIMLGSKAVELSQEKLIHIRTIIEQNTLLRPFWPECFWHEPQRQATAWNNEHIFLPRREAFKEGSIETTGVGGTITGEHFNVIFCDDIVDEKDRFSPTTMDRAYAWLHAAHFLLDDRDHAHEIFLGTHWSNNDVYVRMKREDTELVHKTFSAIQQDGTPLWPEVFPLPVLQSIERKLADAGQADLYALNYLNDPHHLSIVAFDTSKLRYFRVDGDKIILDDDPRDHELSTDFTRRKVAAATYQRGQRMTPDFYRANRADLAGGLRAMYFGKASVVEETVSDTA